LDRDDFTIENRSGSQPHFTEYNSPIRENSDFPARICPAGLDPAQVEFVDGI
jgi:hypothetical protein